MFKVSTKTLRGGGIDYASKNIDTNNTAESSKNYYSYGYSWGKIFKREIYENLKFPIGFWFEDMINGLVINPAYKNVFLLNSIVYGYTLNPNGITSSSKKSLKILDSYFVLEEIITHFDNFKIKFEISHYHSFLYEASHQIFVRLRRYDKKYMKSAFVLLCELNKFILKNYSINTENLSKLEKSLVVCFESKKFNKWKNISVFYN